MVIQIYTSSSLPPNKLDEQLRKPIKTLWTPKINTLWRLFLHKNS